MTGVVFYNHMRIVQVLKQRYVTLEYIPTERNVVTQPFCNYTIITIMMSEHNITEITRVLTTTLTLMKMMVIMMKTAKKVITMTTKRQ